MKLNHQAKVRMGRAMMTTEERKERGRGPFNTKAWAERSQAIRERVERHKMLNLSRKMKRAKAR